VGYPGKTVPYAVLDEIFREVLIVGSLAFLDASSLEEMSKLSSRKMGFQSMVW